MPGTHSPISRHLFTLDGMVLTSGGAKNLAKGQFTIVNSGKAGANGAVVVSNFAGQPDSTVYAMRLGKHRIPENRTAANSQPYSSHLFKIKDVVDVKANFPKHTEQKFDELLIGYDGINADTAIELDENMTTVLDVTLSGDHIGFATGNCKYTFKLHFGREEGETNQDVMRKAVERLKEQTALMGVSIDEFIGIKLVDSTTPELSGTPYVFSELTITDGGDSNDLARVQSQYPAYVVARTGRSGLRSVYTILHPASATLANYVATDALMYIKNCEDCRAGYAEIEGGVVYSVTLEDDGVDLSTTVDNLPGFVTGSVIRHGVKNGRGLYTIVLDNALTEAEINTYVTTAGVQTTATIELLGTVEDVCSDENTTSTAWVDVQTCYANTNTYTIQLRDNDCGESRLAELQAAYPELVIEEGAPTGTASRALTLSGTTGTANVTVAGEAYLATYATSLTVTADDFVTAHAADLLSDHGITVTANAGVLTFAGGSDAFPVISIANATGTLNGTLAAVDYGTTASAGACQRVYSTQVITDVICEECDPMFLGQFTSEAPQAYDFTEWELVLPEPNEDALMGIKLTGKPFIWRPTDISRDQIPFYETSTRIEVSGGYVEDVNQSFDPYFSDIFNIKRLSRAQDRDNLGGHLMQWEDVSRTYFTGDSRHENNMFARAILGEESVLRFDEQYVSFAITVKDNGYSQGVGRSSDMGITYIIWAPLGRHQDLQEYVNSLAARAGMSAVSPITEDFS